MAADGGTGRVGADGAEGRFEEELVVRLGARVRGVGGSPPLADLRAAGRRRARRGLALRAVVVAAVLAVGAGAAVLAVGAGALTQLGAGGGAGSSGPARGGESPSDDLGGLYGGCRSGPAALRMPSWEQLHGLAPTPTHPAAPSWTPPRPEASASLDQVARHTREVANAIRSFGAREYPEYWFGACTDVTTDVVYVMVASGSDIDKVLPEAVPHTGVTVQFVYVGGSRKYYQALAERITSEDAAYWAQRGVKISEIRISEDGTGLIFVTQQAAAAKADILARYGAKLVIEVRPID
ncbi:hypothetical protein [Kitasatospora sp. NPDC091207]|uniref:hypothetical protein n=1 Tax=Kitasatospora sp. NPDC091207 TaxID=3364083 RepID=UPI00380693B9